MGRSGKDIVVVWRRQLNFDAGRLLFSHGYLLTRVNGTKGKQNIRGAPTPRVKTLRMDEKDNL
jgi:hypothetical protein